MVSSATRKVCVIPNTLSDVRSQSRCNDAALRSRPRLGVSLARRREELSAVLNARRRRCPEEEARSAGLQSAGVSPVCGRGAAGRSRKLNRTVLSVEESVHTAEPGRRRRGGRGVALSVRIRVLVKLSVFEREK